MERWGIQRTEKTSSWSSRYQQGHSRLKMHRCCCLVAKSCPILCHPMDCSLPDSSVHGILQARILEWVAIPFSRRSSWPRIEPKSPALAGGFFTTEPPGKPHVGLGSILMTYNNSIASANILFLSKVTIKRVSEVRGSTYLRGGNNSAHKSGFRSVESIQSQSLD